MALVPGMRLGPYEILSPLGAGGMGEVFRARDTRLGRDVAIKVLPDHLSGDKRALARFESEARAVAALSHPNILALFDVGETNGVHFAVTELLDGETLRSALRRGPIPWREAAEIAASIAEGLEAAHARGLVHRDVKPENIFLCSTGHPKILDFGLAKKEATGPDANTESLPAIRTAPGALLGTVGYMAPEQLRGLQVDHRADIFAFGCVLYEMLSGHRAFPGHTASEVIAAILHEAPPPLEGPSVHVPVPLREVVSRCLKKASAERFSSARDVAFSLQAIASGEQLALAALPAGRFRHRALAALAASAALLATVAGLRALRSPAGLPPFQPRQVTSGPGCESDPALSPDGEVLTFVAEQNGRTDLWVVDVDGGRPLRLTDDPERESSPAWLPDGRTIVYAAADDQGTDLRKVPRFGGPPQTLIANGCDPAISPDGRFVAFSREAGNGGSTIWTAPLADPGKARRLTREADGLYEQRQPAFSPDGTTICYRDFHDLWLVPVAGGAARRLTADGPADFDPAFSPDGLHVYFASYREATRAVWRIGIGGGTPERVTLGTGMEIHPALSRDGRRLCYATHLEGNSLVLVDRRTGARTRAEESRLAGFGCLDPKGRFLVYTSTRENAVDLWSLPLSDGRPAGPPRRLTELGGRAACPDVSPDGRFVAFYLVREKEREILVVPSGGGEPVPVAPHAGTDTQPSWSPDGTQLAFVSDRGGSEQVWTVPMRDGRPAGNPHQRTRTETWAAFPRFLPGGLLACTSGDAGSRDVWIVDLEGRHPARRVTSGTSAWYAFADPGTETLLVLAEWAEGRCSVRAVPIKGGEPRSVPWGEPADLSTEISSFTLSADGRLAALVEESRRGDVWVLEAGKGKRF